MRHSKAAQNRIKIKQQNSSENIPGINKNLLIYEFDLHVYEETLHKMEKRNRKSK